MATVRKGFGFPCFNSRKPMRLGGSSSCPVRTPAPTSPAADPDSLSTSRTLKRDFFSRREWNFTMENDVFVRYLCFRDADELAKAIQQKQPHKIDVGAVFSAKVRACACQSAGLLTGWPSGLGLRLLARPGDRPGGARGVPAGSEGDASRHWMYETGWWKPVGRGAWAADAWATGTWGVGRGHRTDALGRLR
jgi:hypothetical protein